MKTSFCSLISLILALNALANGKERALDLAAGHKLGPGSRIDGAEIVCDNGRDPSCYNGFVWTLKLNQREPAPFTVEAESRADVTPGGSDEANYSLYLDITYMDGSRLYGQHAPFAKRPGLGWQRRLVTVVPDKPVKLAQCYLLFRYQTGCVRFRTPRLRTFEGTNFTMFDTWFQDISSLAETDGQPRFLIRDAAAEGDFKTIQPDGKPVEGIKIAVTTSRAFATDRFDVAVENTSGGDRAVTLVYALPLPKTGDLVWYENPRRSETLTPTAGQRRATTNVRAGEGPLTKWPFGAVSAGGKGLALGYDPAGPAIFRVTVNAKTRELLIAFDLGFAPEKNDARFRFVKFEFPAELGFRGALREYQGLFPDNNVVRLKKHGLWMAFHKISAVEGWEDFGFAVKEGDNEPAWDDAHGLVTLHYTEPTSWWMSMKAGTNGYTFADCLARAEQLAAEGNPFAKAWQVSTYRDLDGQITGTVRDTPWCVGAVWNLCSLPGIKGGEYDYKLTGPAWDKRYAHTFPEGVDGEYIDSAEPYMAPALDFSRAHFAAAKTPLAYDPSTKRPGIAKALSVYEYVRTTADRCHAMGRYLMGNGIPYSWPWLVPFSDYGGQETKWIDAKGKWIPMSDDELLYRRALSGAKPYCFLMNVNFDKFPPELVEKYMQRSLAYGLFPCFFSPNASGGHYFSRPELYNRDRPLFKKYVPLCRLVSEAGWRAVNTLAESLTDGIFVEQFGDDYLTVFNPGTKPATARIRLHKNAAAVKELVTGSTLPVPNGQVELNLPAETVRLLSFK